MRLGSERLARLRSMTRCPSSFCPTRPGRATCLSPCSAGAVGLASAPLSKLLKMLSRSRLQWSSFFALLGLMKIEHQRALAGSGSVCSVRRRVSPSARISGGGYVRNRCDFPPCRSCSFANRHSDALFSAIAALPTDRDAFDLAYKLVVGAWRRHGDRERNARVDRNVMGTVRVIPVEVHGDLIFLDSGHVVVAVRVALLGDHLIAVRRQLRVLTASWVGLSMVVAKGVVEAPVDPGEKDANQVGVVDPAVTRVRRTRQGQGEVTLVRHADALDPEACR